MTDLPAAGGLLDQLGARAQRRMTPRAGIALAGAGALIGIGGAMGLGGDHLVSANGDVRRLKGIVVSIALLALAVVVLRRFRSGPLATAAATAGAVGVPALVFFASFEEGHFPPFSFSAVLLVSAIVWLAAYVFEPARGRMLFLALALVAIPLFVMEQSEHISKVPEGIGAAFTRGFMGVDDDPSDNVSSGFDVPPAPDFPDPTNLGIISLAFGAAYAYASLRLTRGGYAGTATPFAALGAVLLIGGALFLSSDLHEIPTGLLLMVIGLGVVYVGAASSRRFTTWVGALSFGLGAVVVVAKVVDGANATVASLVFLAVGTAVVIGAHHATLRVDELAEEDERRSFRHASLVPVAAEEHAAGSRDDRRGGGDRDVDGPPYVEPDE